MGRWGDGRALLIRFQITINYAVAPSIIRCHNQPSTIHNPQLAKPINLKAFRY